MVIRKKMIYGLESLGLTKNESKLYLALMGRGGLKVSEILKISGIGSGKIYENLDSLVERGLVSQVLVNNVKTFCAANPEYLFEIVKKKESKFNVIKKEVEKLVPQLKEGYSFNESKSQRVEIYLGDNGFVSALNILIENLEDELDIYVIGANQDRKKLINFKWGRFCKEFDNYKNIRMKMLVSGDKKNFLSFIEELNVLGVDVKSFDMFSLAPITVLKDYVLINDYVSNKHILIKNEYVAKGFRDMFLGLWSFL